MQPTRFVVRVYGILVWKRCVLMAHEVMRDYSFIKFPGGGLELGEGVEAALRREFYEECGISITIVKHLYTTGFFQASAFNPADQIISIYYLVETSNPELISVNTPITVSDLPHTITFEWKRIDEVTESDVTFTIDKYLVRTVFPTLL